MAELAARHLIGNGVKEVLVSNRTHERACDLAKEFNGRPVKFDDFILELARTDIVICSTGAPHYILAKGQMQKVMKERKQRQVFIIDISVPRNIDPEINNLDNVYLYNVDDLQGVVDTNKFERRREAAKAEKIVEEELETFQKWLSSLDSVPTIVALREKAEEIKKEELDKLFNKIQGIGEKEREAIEYMATALTNKLIHSPTAALKDSSEDKDTLVAIIRKLYGINGEKVEKK
jgi:glutamyl-tRNA reductase